jgi:hypothetical protein
MTMLKKAILASFVMAAAALVSCSDDHGTEPAPFDVSAPETPADLTVTPGPASATVQWSFDGDAGSLEEFRVYYYFSAYGLLELVGTTEPGTTSYTDTGLVGNVEYCYVVSAVDTFGMEGARTGEECVVAGTP